MVALGCSSAMWVCCSRVTVFSKYFLALLSVGNVQAFATIFDTAAVTLSWGVQRGVCAPQLSSMQSLGRRNKDPLMEGNIP